MDFQIEPPSHLILYIDNGYLVNLFPNTVAGAVADSNHIPLEPVHLPDEITS